MEVLQFLAGVNKLRDIVRHPRLLKEATKTILLIISISVIVSNLAIPMANLHDIIFEENADNLLTVTDVPKSHAYYQ